MNGINQKNGTKYLLGTENADNKLSGIVTERNEPKYTLFDHMERPLVGSTPPRNG